MAVVNHAKIMDGLEQATSNLDKNEFIFSFLSTFAFPKSTIKLLKEGSSRNVAKIDGHIGIKKKLYFQPADMGSNIHQTLDELLVSTVVCSHDLRFVIVTDFENLVAYDSKVDDKLDISFNDLHLHYGFFLPLVGLEKAVLASENIADVKAAEKMGKLFDLIKERNDLSKPADVHALNVFLTRLLFCFFAEDTGIFAKSQFTGAIESYTHENGEDMDQFLADLFTVLNTPPNGLARQNKPHHLTDFPYVNGGLFKDDEPMPEFGAKGRRLLIECGKMGWASINPDIFGSMFQAVIDEDQRSRLGQHYTSVSNIMKVIKPLFLDKLYTELEKHRGNDKQLRKLLMRIADIKVFDPACGSGNFLIIAYKELRQLEMAIFKAIGAINHQPEIFMSGISLDHFYGIEIDDFAHEIARLSLWLTEHQLNQQWEADFGQKMATLPLKSSGNIVSGNSLQLDWNQVCPKTAEDEVYVIGNPPFLGTLGRTDLQKKDMQFVFNGFGPLGYLDYVACWFWKGAQYIQNSQAELALVATNSICQGEQASTLWPSIFALGLKIHIAYQSFVWANNARDKAAVHVVVVGLSSKSKNKYLFQDISSVLHGKKVSNISPYLIEGPDIVVGSLNRQLNIQSPKMVKGNQATDGGYLFLDSSEKEQFLLKEPEAKNWIRPVLGAEEFLNGKERWCLWLVDATSEELADMPAVMMRLDAIRDRRLAAGHPAALKMADKPHIFMQVSQPRTGEYILVPSVSSERRTYVPMGFFDANVISTNLNYIIPNGSLYEFGILSSLLHNDWMRLVAGRLESRYRYSATIVYNTFPWPDSTPEQRNHIEALAQEILLVRADYPDKTLAQLYDPDLMPEQLKQAHHNLDLAVDALYQTKPFADASERLSCLLARYEKLVAAEQESEKQKPVKKSKKAELQSKD
jgi:N-6 DNA Methylase.